MQNSLVEPSTVKAPCWQRRHRISVHVSRVWYVPYRRTARSNELRQWKCVARNEDAVQKRTRWIVEATQLESVKSWQKIGDTKEPYNKHSSSHTRKHDGRPFISSPLSQHLVRFRLGAKPQHEPSSISCLQYGSIRCFQGNRQVV